MNQDQALMLLKKWNDAITTKTFKEFAMFCRIYSESKGCHMYMDSSQWTVAQKQFDSKRQGKDIVLKPRRIGFTTLEIIRDLFFALTNPGTRTVIVAQEEKLGQDSIAMIKDMIEHIEELNGLICKALDIDYKMIERKPKGNWNTSEIELANGSRIQYLVAKNQERSADRTGRGIGISRLHCTETAFWLYPELAMKSLLNAANNAKEVVIESTPNGAHGWFYDFYMGVVAGSKGNDWKHHFFPWFEHEDYRKLLAKEDRAYVDDFMQPKNEYETRLIHEHNITKEQLNWYRNKVAESSLHDVLQEYPIDIVSCFKSKGASFLDESDYAWLELNAMNPIRTEITDYDPNAEFQIYQEPQLAKRYLIGSDVSYGREQDFSSICVIDEQWGNIVATFASNKISPTNLARLIYEVATRYNNAFVGVEIQAAGQATISELIDNCRYYNVYKHKDKDYYGFNTTQTTRVAMFNLLQQIVKERKQIIPDKETINQTRNLIVRNGRIDHTKYGHDDRVIGYLVAQYIRNEFGVGLADIRIQGTRRSEQGFQRMGRNPFGFSRN